MKTRPAFLSAFLLLLITPSPARAGEADITVTATVQPKRVVLSDVKPNKPVETTVTYTITNRTAETQVVDRFCTLRPGFAGDDGRLIILNAQGTDASRPLEATDILIIAPGRQQTLQLGVRIGKTGKGITLMRSTEDLEVWAGGTIGTPKFIDITALYVNSLTKADIEKMRPELKGANYTLAELKLPAIRLEVAP